MLVVVSPVGVCVVIAIFYFNRERTGDRSIGMVLGRGSSYHSSDLVVCVTSMTIRLKLISLGHYHHSLFQTTRYTTSNQTPQMREAQIQQLYCKILPVTCLDMIMRWRMAHSLVMSMKWGILTNLILPQRLGKYMGYAHHENPHTKHTHTL